MTTPMIELPEGTYIAIDADCPGCGWPERRARFDEHGAIFSCRKCNFVSRTRDAEPVDVVCPPATVRAGDEFCPEASLCEVCGGTICPDHSDEFTSCGGGIGLHHLDCRDECDECQKAG